MSEGDNNEQDAEPPRCDCCGYDNPVGGVEEYKRQNFNNPGTKLLCEICAGTLAGTYYEYPEMYRQEFSGMAHTCWCTNHLLSAMKGNA